MASTLHPCLNMQLLLMSKEEVNQKIIPSLPPRSYFDARYDTELFSCNTEVGKVAINEHIHLRIVSAFPSLSTEWPVIFDMSNAALD